MYGSKVVPVPSATGSACRARDEELSNWPVCGRLDRVPATKEETIISVARNAEARRIERARAERAQARQAQG